MCFRTSAGTVCLGASRSDEGIGERCRPAARPRKRFGVFVKSRTCSASVCAARDGLRAARAGGLRGAGDDSSRPDSRSDDSRSDDSRSEPFALGAPLRRDSSAQMSP